MDEKDLKYYKQKLLQIYEDIKAIEADPSYNLALEKKSLDLLEKMIELKEVQKSIAILEHKDKHTIEKINKEITLYYNKLTSYRKAFGFKNDDLIRALKN